MEALYFCILKRGKESAIVSYGNRTRIDPMVEDNPSRVWYE
jgi:hypothetical protein